MNFNIQNQSFLNLGTQIPSCPWVGKELTAVSDKIYLNVLNFKGNLK